MKNPQGTPSNACPITRTSRESACILSANPASEGGRVKAHEEGDENRGVHHEERAECCPAVAQSVGHRTSEKDTDERTTLASLEKR